MFVARCSGSEKNIRVRCTRVVESNPEAEKVVQKRRNLYKGFECPSKFMDLELIGFSNVEPQEPLKCFQQKVPGGSCGLFPSRLGKLYNPTGFPEDIDKFTFKI